MTIQAGLSGTQVHNSVIPKDVKKPPQCPAKRRGGCAFEGFYETCHTKEHESCFGKIPGKTNPKVMEWRNAQGKTIRIIMHVTDEPWRWGADADFMSGMGLDYVRQMYGGE